MTPEQYRKIGDIYHAALDLDSESRLAFLNQMCGDDDLLRREVEQLLLSHQKAGDFLNKPAIERVVESAVSLSLSGRYETLIGREFGQYQVLSKIGAGGMGEVFLAEDNRLGRKVALKLLPPQFVTDSVRVRRFEREARAASATTHPNIVSIYDIGQSDDIHYIASEYVEGETLRRRIRRLPLQPIEALDIALQVANALDSAHSAGFIHRDIKPENIMIRPDGFVKVLDFGLALITKPESFRSPGRPSGRLPSNSSESGDQLNTSTDTLPGTVMGTVNYMSPEQVRGQKADERSDLWSLGVVLFEMLSGHSPFQSQSAPDMFVSILDRQPLPLKNVPAELERIILKLLAKNREDRFQSAQELAAELKLLKRRLEFEIDSQSVPATSGQIYSSSQALAAETVIMQSASGQVSQHPSLTIPLPTGNLRKALIALSAIVILGLAAGGYWLLKGQAPIGSIAIMPLVNQTNDGNLEYITDGITETLIYNISKLPDLKVTSRTSVFRYKKQQQEHSVDPTELGDKFHVDAILTGRVIKVDQTLIFTLELISTRDGSLLWNSEYRHQISNLLAAQTVISQRVSEHLRSQLTGAERAQISKRSTENEEAYRLYLNGRFEWYRQSLDGFPKAIEHYKQAIAEDPNYALAYAGLAEAYGTLAANGLGPREYAQLALENAATAVRLDDQSAEAHLSLGTASYFDWNLTKAEQELRRAISINANLAEAHSRLSAVLQGLDRFDDAIAAGQRALELDPYSLRVHLDLQFAYFYAGRYDQCIEVCQKMLLIESRYFPAHLDMGRALEQKKLYDQAITELTEARQLSNDEPLTVAALGHAYAVSGKLTEARQLLGLLLQAAQRGIGRPYEIAKVYAGLNDKDRAFEWLEKAFQDHSPWLLKLKSDPNFENLRSDARFQSLVQRTVRNQER